ncbi:MAG: PAS domain S-box protein [Syntrophales bacterium]
MLETKTIDTGYEINSVRELCEDTLPELMLRNPFFNSLIDSIPDIMFCKDTEGIYLDCNTAFAMRAGLAKEKIIGKKDFDIFPLVEAELYHQKDQMTFTHEKHRYDEEWISYPDGRRVLIETRRIPYYGPDGKLTGVIGVGRDITDRKNIEDQSQHMTAKLQQMVAERTVELRKTNLALQREINERKKTEAALRASEERFRSLVETTSDWVWEVDENAVFTYASPKVNALLGYKPDDVIGKKPFDLMPPDEAQRLAKLTDAIIKSREPFAGLENINLCKDGRRVVLETSGVPILDGEGNLLSYRGIARDITDRKRAEETVTESEKKYRTILESIEDAYFELDLSGNMTFFNHAAQRTLKYLPEELLGMNYQRYSNPEAANRMFEIFHDIYGTGKSAKVVDFEIITKDGVIITLEMSASLMRDHDNHPTGFRCLARDVTERKRADEALRESEEKYRSLASTEDSMYLIDRDCRYLFVNEKHLQRLGLSQEEVIARSYGDLHSEGDTRAFTKSVEKVLESGEFLLCEHRSQRDNKYFLRTFTPVRGPGGRTTAVTVVSKDITERKQAEAEHLQLEQRLNRAEKMEALGTLAGGVAHDLNNVMGVLVGYSELLLERIPEGNPLRSYASGILQSSERGATIIQDLLTLGRRGVAVSEVVNLNKVITDYFEAPEFEKLKEYHSYVTFKSDLEENLSNIKGSPVHLEKTFMNLVSNASEAISGQGEVMIRTKSFYIDKPIGGYDDVRKGDYVVLTVSDNGRGISAADIKKIFEPFYTKKVMGRSGTGLGLAVVWGTVKDHDGYIDVQSEDGKGSTFAIYLPATSEELIGDEQKTSPEQYMGRGETILVVDDLKEQREVATSMLTRLGYRVETVSSGEEAIAYLRSNKADLIVLDMIMDPGMHGLETYRRVLTINPKQKAIIVSGFSETNRVKKALELGAGAYVKKPYMLEKIGLAIKGELTKAESPGS